MQTLMRDDSLVAGAECSPSTAIESHRIVSRNITRDKAHAGHFLDVINPDQFIVFVQVDLLERVQVLRDSVRRGIFTLHAVKKCSSDLLDQQFFPIDRLLGKRSELDRQRFAVADRFVRLIFDRNGEFNGRLLSQLRQNIGAVAVDLHIAAVRGNGDRVF